jgi:hypothetical protein
VIAHREIAAGICETARAEHFAHPYASALAALRANCPAYVPEDRWRQGIADAMAFISKWGAQAQAFGWTACELFGLHPVPERPAPSYRRLSRYDETGLIWLLRSRPVVALTKTNAAIQGATAVLTYRKINKPALALLWQIYLRRFSLQIPFLQYGHRCGGSRTTNATMAWRTAGNVG